MHKKSPSPQPFPRRLLKAVCLFSALMCPAGWGCFIRFTANPFALDGFTVGAFWLCVAGAFLPMALNLLAWVGGLNKPGQGWLFGVGCFALGALCWMLSMGTSWFSWKAAADMGRITRQLCIRLRLCAALGLIFSLVPLIPGAIAMAKHGGQASREEK